MRAVSNGYFQESTHVLSRTHRQVDAFGCIRICCTGFDGLRQRLERSCCPESVHRDHRLKIHGTSHPRAAGVRGQLLRPEFHQLAPYRQLGADPPGSHRHRHRGQLCDRRRAGRLLLGNRSSVSPARVSARCAEGFLHPSCMGCVRWRAAVFPHAWRQICAWVVHCRVPATCVRMP